MASLIGRKDEYDIATGNDADSDRHGIVTPDAGLMNPNHFLAVAIGYLFGGARPDWPDSAQIGKTLVSSSMIDRVAASLGQADGRGAGRLQVVRARADRRVVRLRWRGVGRGVVPAPRRRHVDHRQGRHHPGAARLGDPGRDRTGPRASTTPTWWRGTASRRTPASTRRRPRAEGQARRALARRRDRDRARRRADHRQADRGPRQRRRRSAASRSPPSRPGSPPAPPAPRTSTRSTPSPSRAPTTSHQVQDEAREVVSAALGG